MPRKPLRQCAINNCPNIVEKDGDIYCKEHKSSENKKYNEISRGYISGKRYDGRWNKVRGLYIKSHPFCEECIKENRFVKATVIHHKLPIENGGDKYDMSNLESLCQHHHMEIHKTIGKTQYKF